MTSVRSVEAWAKVILDELELSKWDGESEEGDPFQALTNLTDRIHYLEGRVGDWHDVNRIAALEQALRDVAATPGEMSPVWASITTAEWSELELANGSDPLTKDEIRREYEDIINEMIRRASAALTPPHQEPSDGGTA